VAAAIDDGLRRVDGAGAEGAHIVILPVGVVLVAQRVLPTEIVPVIDVVGERDDVVLGCQLGKESVGRRTGIAALAGEKLDHAQGPVNLGPANLGLVGLRLVCLGGAGLLGKPGPGKRREGQRKSRKP
jgi:hypothetical protein